jgi:hypothetical protein
MPMQLSRPIGFQPGGAQYYESQHPCARSTRVFAGFVQDVLSRGRFQLTRILVFVI